MRRLAGGGASVGPTLTSLTRPFGLQCLLGKRLAVVPDARIDRQVSKGELIERLLSLIGGDEIEVERKNLGNVSLRDPPRFVM